MANAHGAPGDVAAGADEPEVAIVEGPVYEDFNDYTFYLEKRAEVLEGCPKKLKDLFDPEKNRTGSIEFQATVRDRHGAAVRGRLLACRCFGGLYASVTVRKLDDIERPEGGAAGCTAPVYAPEFSERTEYYKPSTAFSVPAHVVCNVLGKLVFPRGRAPSGLLLITGATDSAKSVITRGLIHLVLQQAVRRRAGNAELRPPHLVTFEDPIEKYLKTRKEDEPGPDAAKALGIDYTPRERPSDTHRLAGALRDALRQTPSVFFVGEVRSEWDWPELMGFAATGHLLVATAHAGSLVEAMGKILEGVKAGTAAQRGQYAQRVLGVIHLMKADVEGERHDVVHERPDSEVTPPMKGDAGGKSEPMILPALWRGTPGGIASLVGDGLSSILPNNPKTGDQEGEDRTSSFGRRWFARRLTKECGAGWKTGVAERYEAKAIELDLRGI